MIHDPLQLLKCLEVRFYFKNKTAANQVFPLMLYNPTKVIEPGQV